MWRFISNNFNKSYWLIIQLKRFLCAHSISMCVLYGAICHNRFCVNFIIYGLWSIVIWAQWNLPKCHQMQEITTEKPSFPFYRYCECGHISIGVHWWLLCACLSVPLNFMFWLFCSAQNRFAACVAIMINSQMCTHSDYFPCACSLVKRQYFSLIEWWACANPKLFFHSVFVCVWKHGIEMDMNELPERHQRTNTWFFNMKQVFPRTHRTKP